MGHSYHKMGQRSGTVVPFYSGKGRVQNVAPQKETTQPETQHRGCFGVRVEESVKNWGSGFGLKWFCWVIQDTYNGVEKYGVCQCNNGKIFQDEANSNKQNRHVSSSLN